MSTKKLYFGSNFKMYKNIAETKEYLQAIIKETEKIDKERIQLFFIPSYTSLESASKLDSNIRNKFMLGAQNMCWEDSGQFTGEISPVMLKELGIELVMIGHSERRHGFHEDNVMENRKVRKALESGFTTLLCVGETAEEKNYGIGKEVIRTQLKTGLHKVEKEKLDKLWVAYEPVWAIGVNGTPASTEYAQDMHKAIRSCIEELYGEKSADVPILYGGSVNLQNAEELIVQQDIDGLFTTRTAFQVKNFAEIIRKSI